VARSHRFWDIQFSFMWCTCRGNQFVYHFCHHFACLQFIS
jgi:hypothetical protein